MNTRIITKGKIRIAIITAIVLCLTMVLPGAGPAFAYAEESDGFQTTIDAFSYGDYQIPAYDGDPSEEVNQNLPAFSEEELTADPYVHYGDLDGLGRCTTAESLLQKGLMPTWERGSIKVEPTGWINHSYDVVPAGWVYNRCHLIGWQLTGADLTSMTRSELLKDLMTGTKQLNVGNGSTGMVGYENEVAAYLKENEDHEVAYRVTPIFEGDNLVASGVLMEGQSVAANDVEFCAFVYNVQPQIAINYATGENRLASSIEDNKPISDCEITVGQKAVYSGAAKKVSITIIDEDRTLTEGADYETVWKSNLLPGRASVTIAGIGSYRGTATFDFIIVPAKAKISKLKTKKSGRKASIRIAVKAQKGVSGYQYAWRLKGKKKWSSVSFQGKVRIIKKLKKGKRYQVRIRAYKIIDGKKHYGEWSKIRTIRTRK